MTDCLFPSPHGSYVIINTMLKYLLKTMRPKQWVKNVFVLAAIVFDRQLTNINALAVTIGGVIIFCLLSSTVYILNDIADVEADRQHPKKRNRPIASGKLSVTTARIAAIAILVICFPAAWFLSPSFALIAFAYFIMNLLYSKWLKHIPLIDVMIIATGFVLRVVAGVSLIQVERFSPWLYVCTTLLALFMGFGKRRSELVLLAEGANSHRKVLEGYTIELLDQMILIVCASTLMAYTLYTVFAVNLPDNNAMMLSIPFVLYAMFRYLYLVQVKGAGGAPEDLVLTDRPLQIAGFLWGVTVLIIFYLF
ncbi:MAG: decaprenyl-phosphate phosphoribosyltransferase [Anaerolineaceae bacterium]|nr:decaprenyl-phosphate phosphoribosyltransferase [Anaerolineaceae bacterium]